MKPTPAHSSQFRIGSFELDLQSGELHINGFKIRLQDQPLEILAMLVDRPGELVTREELRLKVWPADTFVDFQHGLNRAINKLREALGDDAVRPRYIETLPRRGYRLIAPVEVVPNGRKAQNGASDASRPLIAAEVSVVHEQPRRKRWVWALTLGAAGVILAATMMTYLLLPFPPPRVLGYAQITNDGRMKDGIVTDGPRLYFTATSAGQPAIYQVSASGGEVSRFAPTFNNASVADISPKGDELLAVSDILTRRGPMWILSLPGGTSRRVSDLHAGAWYLAAGATWSPDGKTIAYVDSDLYTAGSDGTHSRKIISFAGFPGLPYRLRWSPDGSVLRFSLFDSKKGWSSIWEASPTGANLHRLYPGGSGPVEACCGNWTPDGRYFVFSGEESLWAIREKRGVLKGPQSRPMKLAAGPISLQFPAVSRDGKRLFAIGAIKRGELVRYDARSRQLLPYFSGISAEGADFSRDGAWIAYVTYPEGILWRSKLDGSERRQLTFPPKIAALPRWSPDGKRIAFMAALGFRWKIHLISADGGAAEELIPGDLEEESPNWRPDGESLIFGVNSFSLSLTPPDKFGIYKLDLKTHQASMLFETKGLMVPQLSPDGRYLVAVTAGGEATAVILDLNSPGHGELVRTGIGAVGNWSRGGKYLFFYNLGERSLKINRLNMSSREVEEVASLKDVRLANGFSGYWTGLSPEGSPLFMRDVGSQDIYALDWEAP